MFAPYYGHLYIFVNSRLILSLTAKCANHSPANPLSSRRQRSTYGGCTEGMSVSRHGIVLVEGPGCPHDGAYYYDVGVRVRLLASGLARGTHRNPHRMSPSLRYIAPSTLGDLRRERFSKGHCTCRIMLFLTYPKIAKAHVGRRQHPPGESTSVVYQVPVVHACR